MMKRFVWALILTAACGDAESDPGGTETSTTAETSTTNGTSTTTADVSSGPTSNGATTANATTTPPDGGTSSGGSSSTTSGSGTDGSSESTGGPAVLSTGCGEVATPGYQCFDETFEGVDRRWCAFVPDSYDETVGRSMMLGLHGCGGSPEGVHGGAAAPQEVYASDDYVFVYPAAAASCWDYNAATDSAFVAFVIEQAGQRFCIDPARIFAHGMSSGGMMASRVTCDGLVAGAAAVSLNFSCPEAHDVWLYGGQTDEYYDSHIIPGRDGWIEANGCSAETVPLGDGPCVEYQDCTHRTVWCSDERGHVWPSEPWAAEGIMDFFGSLPGL